jgi:hypothetical protein
MQFNKNNHVCDFPVTLGNFVVNGRPVWVVTLSKLEACQTPCKFYLLDVAVDDDVVFLKETFFDSAMSFRIGNDEILICFAWINIK